MTNKLDPRVPAALDVAGLKYTVDKNENAVVLLGIDDEGHRSQVVIIASTTTEFASQELRTVFSTAYFGEAPDWKVLAYCLKQNSETKLGKWSLQVDEDKRVTGLYYQANIDANLSPSQLGAVIWAVGKEADALEEKISDSDNF